MGPCALYLSKLNSHEACWSEGSVAEFMGECVESIRILFMLWSWCGHVRCTLACWTHGWPCEVKGVHHNNFCGRKSDARMLKCTCCKTRSQSQPPADPFNTHTHTHSHTHTHKTAPRKAYTFGKQTPTHMNTKHPNHHKSVPRVRCFGFGCWWPLGLTCLGMKSYEFNTNVFFCVF